MMLMSDCPAVELMMSEGVGKMWVVEMKCCVG
jgi:hypothetical protein